MAISVSNELTRAFEAEEAEQLSEIIRRKKREDFETLRRLVLAGPDVNEAHRQKAIYALGRWGDAGVIGDIERILPQLAEPGRIAAIDALGRLGTQRALEVIAQYEQDPSAQVRKLVVEACNRIGGTKAEGRLRTIARDDPEEWIRKLALKRLEGHIR